MIQKNFILVATNLTIEHILSQTPNFELEKFGFRDKEDYCSYEHRLGNLTLLEKTLNSAIQKKVPLMKIDTGYDKSSIKMTKKLASDIYTWKILQKKKLIKELMI